MAKNRTTPSDAARIQSTQTRAGNDHGKGSFPARAQGAAARNTNTESASAPKADGAARTGANSAARGGRASGRK